MSKAIGSKSRFSPNNESAESRALDKIVEEAHVRKILAFLAKYPVGSTCVGMKLETGLSATTITRVVGLMESAGLLTIARYADGQHRWYCITPVGSARI